jgi:hypothetical protein
MKNIKRLVLYRERAYSNRNPDYPSIVDNMYVITTEQANEICDYLEKDEYVLVDFVSPTQDPYNEKDFVRNSTFSDGVYAWDAIIIHWIRKYHVRLPNEFLLHLENVKKGLVNTSNDNISSEQLKMVERIYV